MYVGMDTHLCLKINGGRKCTFMFERWPHMYVVDQQQKYIGDHW